MWEQSDSWNISEGTSWWVSQRSSTQEPSEPLWEQQHSQPFQNSSPFYICLDFTSWLKKLPKFRSLDISSSSTFSSAHLCSTISSASHSLWDTHTYLWNSTPVLLEPLTGSSSHLEGLVGVRGHRHGSTGHLLLHEAGLVGSYKENQTVTWSWSHFLSVTRLLWTRHLWKDFTFYNRNDFLKVKYSTSFLDFYFSSKTQMINFPKLFSRSSR